MVYSIALDALLILILLLLIPIGMYRGGIREVCASAGLLLGLQVAQLWSARWGEWLASVVSIDEGVAQFLVAMTIVVLVTGLIGYGAASTFATRPGPGSRVFGGLIALANGVVFLGALVQFVILYLYDGDRPGSIRDSYIARALSSGFDWVVLVVVGCALIAILFGMIVRERETDEDFPDLESARSSSPKVPVRSNECASRPVETSVETREANTSDGQNPVSSVKVKEVRHWEEPAPQSLEELQRGWSRTWPTTVTDASPSSPKRSRSAGSAAYPVRRSEPDDEEVLKTWLDDDPPQSSRRVPKNRPPIDE